MACHGVAWLSQGEPSVYGRETARPAEGGYKKRGRQVAGKDYTHSDLCQARILPFSSSPPGQCALKLCSESILPLLSFPLGQRALQSSVSKTSPSHPPVSIHSVVLTGFVVFRNCPGLIRLFLDGVVLKGSVSKPTGKCLVVFRQTGVTRSWLPGNKTSACSCTSQSPALIMLPCVLNKKTGLSGDTDHRRAQICWDGGLLVCCDECPASYHFDCLGMTEEVRILLEVPDCLQDLSWVCVYALSTEVLL